MLTGKFVTLRVLERKDIEQVRLWRNSPENYGFFANHDFISDVKQESWFLAKAGQPTDLRLMIYDGKSERPIGVTHFESLDHRNRSACWGIYIGDMSYRKRIYAIEAVTLLFDYAFDYLNLRKIYGNTLAGNARGRKFHKLIGFQEEATFKQHVYLDGRYEDLLWISLFDVRWRSHRRGLNDFVKNYKPRSGVV